MRTYLLVFTLLTWGSLASARVVEIGPEPVKLMSPSVPTQAYGCASKLLRRGATSDLDVAALLNIPIFVKGRLPQVEPAKEDLPGDYPEIEYQVVYKPVRHLEVWVREIMAELRRRASNGGAEKEVGVLVAHSQGEVLTVFFTSNHPFQIDRGIYDSALKRFFSEIEASPIFSEIDDLDFLFGHTHSRQWGSSPHSPEDILNDVWFQRWLNNRRFKHSRFRSLVVPLAYEGSVVSEFEPRLHRVI